jgi:ribosome maturation factor RimP
MCRLCYRKRNAKAAIALMESTCDRVARVAEPAIESEGYTLVDVELKGGSGARTLRLFIDRPGKGITLDDCQKVSEILSPLLDVEDIVEGRYFLEISSPGINRRIKKKEDFARFAGDKVKIVTRSPMEGRSKFTGTIEGVEGGEVLIRTGTSKSARTYSIPLAAIEKANLQVL